MILPLLLKTGSTCRATTRAYLRYHYLPYHQSSSSSSPSDVLIIQNRYYCGATQPPSTTTTTATATKGDNQQQTTTDSLIHSYIHNGIGYFKYNQWDRAIENFTKVVNCATSGRQDGQEVKPSDKMLAYKFRGRLYSAKHDYNRAIEDLSKVIELEPNSVSGYAERGDAYYQKLLYSDAIRDYSKAIEILNEMTTPANTMSSIVVFDENDKEYSLHSPSSSSDIDASSLYIKRGNAFRYSGQPEKALSDFTRAIELNPSDVRALCSRAVLYDKSGRYEEAIRDYKKILKMDPTQSAATHSLRSLLESQNRKK